jgi:hypothetical protein
MWLSRGRHQRTSKCSSGKEFRLCNMPMRFKSHTVDILWFENGWILIIQSFTEEKVLKWISCGRLRTTSNWSSGKYFRLCNVGYHWGWSPTEDILWFQNGWILIIQSGEKGYGFQQRASSLMVKTNGCVYVYHCGSSRTEAILWFENGWILILQSIEENVKVNKLRSAFNNEQVV